jgi:hypothetical protein
VRLEPILTQIDASIEAQLRLADSQISDAAAGFMEAFRPTVRGALLEVSAQLGDRQVDVRLAGGDPELVVTASTSGSEQNIVENLEARLTLRLPGSLKGIIEDAASSSGDSINSWVVDALKSRAKRSSVGSRVEETFEL